MSASPGDPPRSETYPFWPVQVINQAILLYLLAGVLVTLVVLAPAALTPPADPLHTWPSVQPPWYFLALSALLDGLPRPLGAVCGLLGFLALLAWPFVDERLARRQGHRRTAGLVGAAVLALYLGLTALGALHRPALAAAPAPAPAGEMGR